MLEKFLYAWPYRIYNSVLFDCTDGGRLGDDDHSSIYSKLKDKAANWSDIRKELGFKGDEQYSE